MVDVLAEELLPCGEAQISFADHRQQHADMWRISIDVWDEWDDVERVFELAHHWSPFIGDGSWPDADMLPLGQLKVHIPEERRETHFTLEEQKSIMTLWCMARSPLMWGGDFLTSSKETFDLLRNSAVLEVQKNSENNRQIYHGYSGEVPGQRIWFADIPDSRNHYLALFNVTDEPQTVTFEFLEGRYQVQDLWTDTDLGVYSESFTRELPAHGSGLYRMSPVKGEVELADPFPFPYEIDAVSGSFTLRLNDTVLRNTGMCMNGYDMMRGSRVHSGRKVECRVPGGQVNVWFQADRESIQINTQVQNQTDSTVCRTYCL
ncbi:MAG: hypothetical protein U5R06_21960 [candidate division KSB1 bacterium]|nr:hypothetical protein [candidate division KSB1 bacterium]